MSIRSWRLLPALLLLAAVACAAPGTGAGDARGKTSGSTDTTSDSSAAASAAGAALAGRTFLSTAVTGHELVEGSRISIAFRDQAELTVRADCNHLLGEYRFADGTLTVQQMGSTEMGCPAPLMQQDVWLADLLSGTVQADLDGSVLTLTSGKVSVELTDREVADPDRPLQGTTWRLDGIMAGETVSTVPRGITATLTIGDGRIHFFDGLHDGDGRARVVDDLVDVTDVFISADGCAPENQCSVDMSMLTEDFHFEIAADRLTVTGGDGNGLIFVATSNPTPGASNRSASTPSPTPTPSSVGGPSSPPSPPSATGSPAGS